MGSIAVRFSPLPRIETCSKVIQSGEHGFRHARVSPSPPVRVVPTARRMLASALLQPHAKRRGGRGLYDKTPRVVVHKTIQGSVNLGSSAY